MKGRDVVVGILQVARGRSQGVQLFGATPDAVVSSLTPLIALLLVAVGLSAVSGKAVQAMSDLLAITVALLAPLVMSYEVARRWGRALEWYRFATALCWCQWAMPVVCVVMISGMTLLLIAGIPAEAATACVVIGLLAYGLWLNWFLAKHALVLSGWRALALVAMVSLTSFVLINVPAVVAALLG